MDEHLDYGIAPPAIQAESSDEKSGDHEQNKQEHRYAQNPPP